jgi:hypothetical protein
MKIKLHPSNVKIIQSKPMNAINRREVFIFIAVVVLLILNEFYKDKDSFNFVLEDNFKDDWKQKTHPKEKNFKKKIFQNISKHKKLSYNQVWSAFEKIDIGGKCGRNIEDIYSSTCWIPGQERYGGQQCGRRRYYSEGGCYNREHSWPKSW